MQADGCALRKSLAPATGRLSVLLCTSGILMSLDIYLRGYTDPRESEIRGLLSDHLCRCTGYVLIFAAALDAAQKLREASANV